MNHQPKKSILAWLPVSAGLLLSLLAMSCSKEEPNQPTAVKSSSPGAPSAVRPVASAANSASNHDQNAEVISMPGLSKQSPADLAWKELAKASQGPPQPPDWQTNKPSEEERAKFMARNAEMAGEAADKAKDFYTKFPDHARASDARKMEEQLLQVAVRLGNTNRIAQMEKMEQEKLKDPNLSEDERFGLRATAAQRAAMSHESEGMPVVMAEFEKGARALQKEFPKRPEPYAMLLEVASNTEGEKSRALAKEISEADAPDEVKDQAKSLLKKLDAVGKPVAIKFTAVDGREVDVAKLGGKVVLVDFWATWCGPCVAELPHVKAAYEKLHDKGFEIVGLSFDNEKEALDNFLKKEKMAWPQYFDGEGWKNKFGQEFGINSIPTMWLIDKKGILRDLNARESLAEKVEKLLAEN